MASLERYQRGYKRKKVNNQIWRSQADYLPYHLENINASPPTIVENAKQQILDDFVFGFQQYNSFGNSNAFSNMSFNELNSFLNEWTTFGDNVIGEEMSQAIAEKLQNDPLTGAGIDKGFRAAIEEGGFSYKDSKGRTRTSESGASLAAQADNLMEQIASRLSSFLDIFEEIKEPALFNKCLELARLGQAQGRKEFSAILAKHNRKKYGKAAQQQLSAKVEGEFASLKKAMDILIQVASQGKSGAGVQTMKNYFESQGIEKWRPRTLGKQLGGIFSALGGEEVGELVGQWAANVVLKEGKEEVLNIIKKYFEATGGKITASAHQTGQELVELGGVKFQRKGDWEIALSIGGVSVNIPISQKLAQRSSSNSKGYVAGGEPFEGKITPQSISLERLLAMTLEGSPAWFEQYMAVLSDEDETTGKKATLGKTSPYFTNATKLWDEFRSAARYIGLFRALVGTGASAKGSIDFAALFIVNNEIISMGDILQAIVKDSQNQILSISRGWGKSLTENLPSFTEMRTEVSEKFFDTDQEDFSISERLEAQRAAIKKLYGKKYRFEIDMALLRTALK